MSWAMQAVTSEGSSDLPPDAVAAFASVVGPNPEFSSGIVRFGPGVFRKLTGFLAEPSGRLSRRDVARAADAASPQRAKALSNCYGDFDYDSAAAFLRICAAHKLSIQAVR